MIRINLGLEVGKLLWVWRLQDLIIGYYKIGDLQDLVIGY